MSRKGKSITLSISERDKTELLTLAQEWGYEWGERGNISGLIEAIARRQLKIAPNNDWSELRIKTLVKIVGILTDGGKSEEAQAIANLLLERSELSIPLRQEVEKFLDNLPPPWRLEIDSYIRRQQPFQLSYQDAASRLWNFTVRYAEINQREEREYLECWCEETEGNLDIPELMHNWSLRLDRLPETAIVPIDREWLLNLDYIEVEMHLLRGLAFAYQSKSNDVIPPEWLESDKPVRRVVRRVSNTFWFFREVRQYGPDCVVVSPEKLRSRIKEKILETLEHYS
ncbi:WYL domain-containing protein [Dapis sp. BLCC M126]|uniref:WYL domain-containing protein n=1 Tax=Dapis sp. BLCC M126 TaxID=3400189 RepID=UPI003CF4D353